MRAEEVGVVLTVEVVEVAAAEVMGHQRWWLW